MFNIYTLLYAPLVFYVVFIILMESMVISVKNDYTFKKHKHSFMENVIIFLKFQIYLIIYSFTPFLNVLILFNIIFNYDGVVEDYIEKQIRKGNISKKDSDC